MLQLESLVASVLLLFSQHHLVAECFPGQHFVSQEWVLLEVADPSIKMGYSADQACGLLPAGARLILELERSAGGARLLCWSSCVLPVG